MAGRPQQKKADIPALQDLFKSTNQVIDPRPIIAFTMRKCGCSFREIAEVFEVTKQMAETIYKNAEKEV